MSNNPFVPCVDLGHGGRRLGAVYGGVQEKGLNLELGRRLNASLAGAAIVPVLTRQADYNPSWAARYKTARDGGARFVLSVHVNAHPTASHLHGAEAYHYPGDDTAREIGRRWLASCPDELRTHRIYEATDDPGPEDDWLQRPLEIIEAFRELPVLVAEVGYLSNGADRAYLQSTWGLDRVVCSLRVAVLEAARLYSP